MPLWLAATVQVPPVRTVIAVPEIVQTVRVVEVNTTVRADVEVALSEAGADPP